MEPRFAPDGRTVLTTHDIGGGHQEIFAIDSATGATTQLTNAPQYPWKWRPSVDPSGSKLIVTYGIDSNAGSGPNSHVGWAPLGLGSISDFTALTPVDRSRPSYDGEYSADGGSIIFDAGGQIWIAAADGSGAHPVAAGRLGRFDRLNPGSILFTHDVGPINTHTQLWAAGLDGSNSHVVADGNFAESFCAMT
jgi:Tol biopolymer transport system component